MSTEYVHHHKFALYRQKPGVFDSNPIIRRVRTNILKVHPLLSFKARSIISDGDPTPVLLNHTIIKEKIPLSGDWEEYSDPLPSSGRGNIKGEETDIEVASLTPSPAHREVKDIDFKKFNK